MHWWIIAIMDRVPWLHKDSNSQESENKVLAKVLVTQLRRTKMGSYRLRWTAMLGHCWFLQWFSLLGEKRTSSGSTVNDKFQSLLHKTNLQYTTFWSIKSRLIIHGRTDSTINILWLISCVKYNRNGIIFKQTYFTRLIINFSTKKSPKIITTKIHINTKLVVVYTSSNT